VDNIIKTDYLPIQTFFDIYKGKAKTTKKIKKIFLTNGA